MRRSCYACGESFEGVGQRRYCSTRCRRRTEKARAKRADLEVRLQIHRLGHEVAELHGDPAKAQHHAWHVEDIHRRLQELPL